MGHTTNHLKIQNIPVNDLPLSTLAARAAILLASTFSTTIKNTLLVKRVKYYLHGAGFTAGEANNILVGLARGDASAAEIASALTEVNTVGPEDTTQVLSEDNAWVIWQNSIHMLESFGVATENEIQHEFSLGKGMPAVSEQGIQVFAFNNDAQVLTTGGVINGMVQLTGVWLRD